MKKLPLILLVAALAFPCATSRAANDTDETRLKLLEIKRRIKDQELQLKELDRKDVEHRKQEKQYREFLELRNKDGKYFDKIVSETKAAIEKCQQESKTSLADQQNQEERLHLWLKMLTANAAEGGEISGAQPGRINALLTLRARCRQLAVQTQMAREAQAKAQERLQTLYETRERYEAFSKFAGASASSIESNLKLGKQRMDALAALKQKGQESIGMLEKEQIQLQSLLDSLKAQAKLNSESPEYLQSLQEPPKPLAGLKQPSPGNTALVNVTTGAQAYAPPPVAEIGVRPPDGVAAIPKTGAKATAGSPPGPPSAETAFTKLFSAPPNTPVLAIESGHVWFAGPFEGWGNLVVIHHKDDMVSVYGYLADIAVRPNINVYKGQEIGWVGPLKASSKSGVSFEARRGTDETRAIDPAKWKPSSGDLKAAILGQAP